LIKVVREIELLHAFLIERKVDALIEPNLLRMAAACCSGTMLNNNKLPLPNDNESYLIDLSVLSASSA